MCLGNLAAEPDNHEEIVKLEAIYALMILLRTEDVESGRRVKAQFQRARGGGQARAAAATRAELPLENLASAARTTALPLRPFSPNV